MLHALDAFARFCKTLYRRQFRTKSSGEFVENPFLTCDQAFFFFLRFFFGGKKERKGRGEKKITPDTIT